MKTFKRIILLVLAALLVFSAAGCKTKKQKEAEELERQKAAAIENAKNFVKNLYINDAKSTGADYEVISQIAVSGTTYEIEWTVEIVSGEAEDVKVTKSEGKTIIDVNENATVATEYKLVATIKGTDVSVSFNHTVPAFKYTSYEEWLDACKKGSQDALVIKGYVICVVAEGSSSAGSIYFQDADGHGYYAYNPTTKPALEYGDEILVKGTGTVYGGQYEFNKGCTVEKTGEKATTLKINDGTADWAAAKSQTDESLIPYQNALVKLTGCTMAEVDGAYYYFTVGNGTAKFNLYDTYYFLSEAQRKAITDQWAAGKTFDIVGLVSCYSKAYQVYPISEDCLSNVSFPQLNDAEAVAVIKDSLVLTQVKFEKDTELVVDVKGYNDQVSISWASNSEQVVFNAETGKLVITLGEADVEVTVTATLTAGEATDTKEFKLTLLSASSDIYVPKAVEEAKAGTYKFALYQATLGKYLYADGTCNDYLGTTEKADKAADFVVALVEGKDDEYTIKVGDKFVEVFENDSQKVRIHLVDTATGAWKYDATLKLFTYSLTGCAKETNNTTYYLGTYSNYTTMSASGTSYISGDKMSTIGVSQFPAYMSTLAPAVYGFDSLEEAKAGTYKFALYQATLGKYLYADGTCNDYLGTTEKADKAADFVVALVEGKTDEYTIKVGDKFVEVFENDSQKVRIHLVDTATGAWKYDATLKLFTYSLTGCAKETNNTTYYLGTYSNYTTMSASGTSYISGDKMSTIGVSQFPAYFGNVTVVEAEWAALEEAKAGTYKFALYQATLGKYLYADGTCNDYLGTTEKYSKAAEFVIAQVEGKTDEYTIKVGDKFVEVFENDSQKVRIHLVDTATGAWKYDATLKLFTYALTGCAKETNNTTYYLGTYSNYTTMSASGTSYISGDKMSTIGVSQFPAYFGDLAEVEDTAKEYEITVATNSSDKAQVKELSAESGVKGSTFTFKVEAEENYVIDSVEVNGQVVEATNGVYTATVTGKMSIRVFTSEAAATEKTIEIDFTQLMQEIPQNKNARHSTTSVEVTVRGVTFDLRNVYQASASYLILAGKLTDADAEGNTSKTPAWIANKTPIPGKIISITVYGNAAGNPSGSAVYYLDAFENAKVEALETSATTITGLKETPLVYTAAEGSNLYYFNLSTTTAANGQITKIVITYEPGEAPQPAPTLTGVSVSGAANVDLVLNAETGLYEGTFSIERQWGRAYFKEVYSDGTNVALTYANATFAGNGILHEKAGGSPENNQLYADTDDMVAAGEFCYGISTKTNYVVSYNPQTKTLTVDVEEPGADATLVGVSVSGAANADLVLNAETGLYEGTFTLGTQWNTVQFIEKYSDDTQNPLTYANATIQGSGIKNEKVEGAPWTSALFIDTDAAVQTGTFCYSLTSETKYLVRYNPETKVLFVDLDLAEVPATVKGVKFGGAKQGSFELKDGKYEAVVSLNQWNRISFTVVDENDKEIALWYTNATFTGAITAENKLGDAYDHTLYHESGDGLQWMPGAGSTRTYKFVYDPSTKTMSVERDTTAPVITVADAVMQALAAHDFVENEDASTLFGQLLAGISANDDMDGAIAVTQEMVDLGGLTLNKLVAGDYKLTITVKDVAGNEAKQEVPIHVRSMYANVDLLADSPNKHADYNSSNWTYDKYTSSWVDVTGTQMRCREKKDANQQSVWTINMACGYSTTYRYKYSTGKSLGIANKITVTWSNDYSSPQEIGVKIILVDAQGNQHYALGAAGNDGFVAIAAGTLLDAQEYTFDDVEVKTVMFVLYSKKSDGAFIYVNDVVLSYEEEQPVSSPAAFQLTNLNVAVPEFTSNHIEGAGVHMWVDPASIGLTMENWGTVTKEVSATVEGYTIGEHFLSDPSADAVRCFVTLDHAPAADEIVTLNVTITIDGQAYQAAVAFQNGALAQ